MARIITRALPLAAKSTTLRRPPLFISSSSSHFQSSITSSSLIFSHNLTPHLPFNPSRSRRFHLFSWNSMSSPFAGIFANLRGFRKSRRRSATKKQAPPPPKEKELELNVKICLEEELPDDPEVLGITEMLKLNVPMAMKIVFDGLHGSQYNTRDTSIDDVGKFDKIELSVLLCNDDFMQKLNKKWRDVDAPTDVLSMSQHIPEIDIPILMLGDVVISVETAARQAEERGHTLLDEIRVLMVHGLLHLLGFDHEISEEAEQEMQKEEELVLKSLGWKGKGLIHDALIDESSNGEATKDMRKAGSLRFYKPKFNYIFCDMDGTLLNSKSRISTTTADALREAMSRGVNIVIATGKTRPAVISALKMVNLTGKNGIVSESSPGIFLQGLIVYGRQGREIYRRNLDQSVCREAFLYSLENEIPLAAFCQDRCLTLFDHPLVDSLHSIYHEPKAEVISSVDNLLAAAEIQENSLSDLDTEQKLIIHPVRKINRMLVRGAKRTRGRTKGTELVFIDTAEGVSSILRPHWEEATEGRAGVVQAQPDMLEIIPAGTSKGKGVRMLLDHLGVSAKEVMAIGDGENDVEMLELVSLGIALSNGSDKAKAIADVIGVSNDEDGAAEAIYKYAF